MKTSQCKSCGKTIVWGQTMGAGKAIPLDFPPQKLMVNDDTEADSMQMMRLKQCWTAHFATCPNAAKHRKRDGKTAQKGSA